MKSVRHNHLWINLVPKLRNIQEQFARHLQGLPTSPDIAKQVKFNQLQNVQRLQVYQNNFKLSLTSNLSAIYPVIEKLVGENFFNYACNEFIKIHPSTHGNLHEYGNEFSIFLSEFEAAKSLSYLPDMARFEWAYHEVFHEASAEQLNLQTLHGIDEEQYSLIEFVLHPASRIIASKFPLMQIWQSNQSENPEPIQLEENEYYFLVARRNNENIFQKLDRIDFDFLSLIKKGQTLGEISNALLLENDESDVDLNNLLVKHVSTGSICDFKISSEPLRE